MKRTRYQPRVHVFNVNNPTYKSPMQTVNDFLVRKGNKPITDQQREFIWRGLTGKEYAELKKKYPKAKL